MITNSGIVIGWPGEEGLEFLLTDDGEYWHFDTIEAATAFITENKNLSVTDAVFKHHVHCVECRKEHFFDPNSIKTDEHGDFFSCEVCQCSIGV